MWISLSGLKANVVGVQALKQRVVAKSVLPSAAPIELVLRDSQSLTAAQKRRVWLHNLSEEIVVLPSGTFLLPLGVARYDHDTAKKGKWILVAWHERKAA